MVVQQVVRSLVASRRPLLLAAAWRNNAEIAEATETFRFASTKRNGKKTAKRATDAYDHMLNRLRQEEQRSSAPRHTSDAGGSGKRARGGAAWDTFSGAAWALDGGRRKRHPGAGLGGSSHTGGGQGGKRRSGGGGGGGRAGGGGWGWGGAHSWQVHQWSERELVEAAGALRLDVEELRQVLRGSGVVDERCGARRPRRRAAARRRGATWHTGVFGGRGPGLHGAEYWGSEGEEDEVGSAGGYGQSSEWWRWWTPEDEQRWFEAWRASDDGGADSGHQWGGSGGWHRARAGDGSAGYSGSSGASSSGGSGARGWEYHQQQQGAGHKYRSWWENFPSFGGGQQQQQQRRRSHQEQQQQQQQQGGSSYQGRSRFSSPPAQPPGLLDHLGALGLRLDAPVDRTALKAAFHQAAKAWHPDMHSSPAAKAHAAAKFLRAKEAYEELQQHC